MGFRGGSVSVLSLVDLEPDESVLVPVNVPSEDLVGDISQGAGAGILNNTRTYLLTSNRTRLKQSGTVKRITIRTGSNFNANKSNLVSLFVLGYRKNGSNTFDQISSSPDIATQFKAFTQDNALFTLDLSENDWMKDLEMADYVGIRMTSNGSTISGIIRAQNFTDPNFREIFLDGTLGSTVDFIGLGTQNSGWLIVQLWMSEPWANHLGSSLSEGSGSGNEGPYDEVDDDFVASLCLPHKLQARFGKNVQNNAWGEANSTVSAILADIEDRINNAKGKIVFLEIGTNDVNVPTSQSDFQQDYKLIIDQIVSNGSIPVIIGIPPRGDLDDTKQQLRIDYNKFLKQLAKDNGYVFAEMDSQIGQRKAGKSAYNEWDLKSSFDSGDNLHFNDTGTEKIADKIERAVRQNDDASSIL